MAWIDERALLRRQKKARERKKATESDLRRAEAALATYQGENSTDYTKAYLFKVIEELMPLFIEEIRILQSDMRKIRRAAKTLAKIYDSVKDNLEDNQLQDLLAKAIFNLSIGQVDDEQKPTEQK